MTTRISITPADAAAAAAEPPHCLTKPLSTITVRPSTGPLFFNAGERSPDGQRTMLDGAHSRVRLNIGGPANDGSVLGSARSEHGGFGVAPNAVTDDTIVMAGGMPMRVRDAVSTGFLARNPDGTFREVLRG